MPALNIWSTEVYVLDGVVWRNNIFEHIEQLSDYRY